MQEEVSAKERKTEQRLGEMCTVAEESEGSQTREQSQRRWLAVLVREKASGLECLCRSCCLAAIFFLLDLHLEARSFLLVQLPETENPMRALADRKVNVTHRFPRSSTRTLHLRSQ